MPGRVFWPVGAVVQCKTSSTPTTTATITVQPTVPARTHAPSSRIRRVSDAEDEPVRS